MNMDLNHFAAAYKASFDAQTAMFPGMIHPSGVIAASEPQSPTIKDYIDKYSMMDDVLAWKMPGAGGGGYLACVVKEATAFTNNHPEAISLRIRRK